MNRQHLTSSRGGWKRFRLPVGALSLAAFAVATPALAAGGFTSATASGNDGNVPASAIDGNLATRWSSDGVGQWIRGDLGAVKALNALDIAWFKGTERTSKFVISTSTDGTNFTQAYAGASSGKSASFERYTFPTVNARYVRVTVNGNTVNTWASISEMAAIAGSTTPTPTPTP
ncbi:discoidin domain-containing protein, partial [Pyxidicoccus fallax]|nr:discoidin domain-containing protein [Pyxidicoccus fallax]